MKMEGITLLEACRRLADQANIEINESDEHTYFSEGEDEACLELYEWARHYFEDLLWNTDPGTAARAYLNDLSIDETTIREWGIGIAPESVDEIRNAARKEGFDPDVFDRVFPQNRFQFGMDSDSYQFQMMFPLRDYRNRVAGYAWRKVAPDQYETNSMTMHPRMYMYGLNQCDQQKIRNDGVWIVNERLEVITTQQHGLDMVVSPP